MNVSTTTSCSDAIRAIADADAGLTLFVSQTTMGWGTLANQLIEETAAREDVAAVHLRLESNPFERALTAKVKINAGILGGHDRKTRLWAAKLHRLARHPVVKRKVAAVQTIAQFPALALAEHADPAVPLSVITDATVLQSKGLLENRTKDEAIRRHRYLYRAERAIYSRADQIVCMSGWALDSVEEDFGVPRARLRICPPMMDEPSVVRAWDRDTGAMPTIAFIGGDWQRKGGDRLLAWYRSRWRDRARLVICSARAPDGIDEAGSVVVHRHADHAMVMEDVLPAADLVVLPSRKDMSPWVIVESMAVGVPVVASAMGGIGELIVDRSTGFLVDPSDDVGFGAAIEALLADRSLRIRMGTAARSRFASNHHGSMAARLVDLLGEMSTR